MFVPTYQALHFFFSYFILALQANIENLIRKSNLLHFKKDVLIYFVSLNICNFFSPKAFVKLIFNIFFWLQNFF